RKRKRCGTCENYVAVECGTCKYCLDKPKFGGNGVLRQSCINKKCHNMASTSQGGYISYVKEPMKLLGDYMSNVMAADREIFQFQNYRFVNELVPKQANNNDCGVFMCSFAYSIAKYKRHKVVIEFGVKNLRQWLSSFILHSINNSSDVNKAIQAIAEKELLSLQYNIISFNKDMINNEACTIDLVEEYLARNKFSILSLDDVRKVYSVGQWLTDSKKSDYYALSSTVFVKAAANDLKNINTYVKEKISDKQAILIPCCMQSHWILAVYWPKRCMMALMDSIGGYENVVEKPLRRLIDKFAELKIVEHNAYCVVVEDVPKQENNSDCGAFVCRFANELVSESLKPYTFETSSIELRSWIVDVFRKSLMPKFCFTEVLDSQLKLFNEELLAAGYIKVNTKDSAIVNLNYQAFLDIFELEVTEFFKSIPSAMLKKATDYCINKNSRLNSKQTAGGNLESSFTHEQHHKLVSMVQNKLEEVMPVLKGGFSVTFDIFYPESGSKFTPYIWSGGPVRSELYTHPSGLHGWGQRFESCRDY
uniref:Ubiquitin-like protease family profile domain-containing protein n=1 Tax=Amphimedon queenslandica TaxID=400682 RepID=A0A1X7TAJ2_AMPQE